MARRWQPDPTALEAAADALSFGLRLRLKRGRTEVSATERAVPRWERKSAVAETEYCLYHPGGSTCHRTAEDAARELLRHFGTQPVLDAVKAAREERFGKKES